MNETWGAREYNPDESSHESDHNMGSEENVQFPFNLGGGNNDNTANFMEKQDSPSSTFKEEKEFLESAQTSYKLDEAMKKEEFNPHSNGYIENLLDEEELKNFNFFDSKERLDKHLEEFVFKELHKHQFSAFKERDKEKLEDFLNAAMKNSKKEPQMEEDKYHPKHFDLLFCPCHLKVPFYAVGTEKCSFDGCVMELDPKNRLIMLSLLDVLSILFSDPVIFNSVLENNLKFKEIFKEIRSGVRKKLELEENSDILDITTGFFIMELINKGYYDLSDLCLTFMMFIDEVEIWKNAKDGKNECMVYLALNEIDPKLRFKKRYLIPFGAFQVRQVIIPILLVNFSNNSLCLTENHISFNICSFFNPVPIPFFPTQKNCLLSLPKRRKFCESHQTHSFYSMFAFGNYYRLEIYNLVQKKLSFLIFNFSTQKTRNLPIWSLECQISMVFSLVGIAWSKELESAMIPPNFHIIMVM